MFDPYCREKKFARSLDMCKVWLNVRHEFGIYTKGMCYTTVEKSTGHEKKGVSHLWLVENETLDQWVFTLGEENNGGEFSHGW